MIRIIALLPLCAFALVAAPQAQAVPITFTAALSGAAEVPPVATRGSGFGAVVFDADAHTMRVQVSFQDLLGGTTASHIHAPINPATGTAPVATQVPSFINFPLGVTAGSYDHTFDTLDLGTYNPAFVTANGGTAASAEAALLGFLLGGDAYLNVHSSQHPSGEIRGNLARVAEPATLALLMAAFGCTVLARRRR